MFGECLENVRTRTPLIHNITNYVTVNDVANILLACGGSPIMSDDIEEVEEITSICGGLNINIGTLNQRTIPAMFAAGKKAESLNHPILLDPVGAGASTLRTKTARDLADQIHFTVIRGNISEIKALVAGSGSTKGVDADVADAVTEENLNEAVALQKLPLLVIIPSLLSLEPLTWLQMRTTAMSSAMAVRKWAVSPVPDASFLDCSPHI